MAAGAADASAAEPSIDPATRWAAVDGDRLLWMEDGEQAVVFDRQSQQTHVLSPAACRALKLLAAGPLDLDELRRAMGEGADSDRPRSGGGGPDGDADLAASLLLTFDALGLAEPADL